MKTIKYLMMAMMAFMVSATFTACNDDDDNNELSNYQKYQEAVNQTVNSQKRNNKVILLVPSALLGNRLTTLSTRS